MADRGEQRLRKQMYKPKQFQKKKRIHPRPFRAAVEGSNNNNKDKEDIENSSSDEENSLEEIQSKQMPTTQSTSTHNVERLLQGSYHNANDDYSAQHEHSAVQEEPATDLDQFLLDVEQPRTPLSTVPSESNDEQLSQWLDSIAIKK